MYLPQQCTAHVNRHMLSLHSWAWKISLSCTGVYQMFLPLAAPCHSFCLAAGHNLSQGPLRSLIAGGVNWALEEPAGRVDFLQTCLAPFISKLSAAEAERLARELQGQMQAAEDAVGQQEGGEDALAALQGFLKVLEVGGVPHTSVLLSLWGSVPLVHLVLVFLLVGRVCFSCKTAVYSFQQCRTVMHTYPLRWESSSEQHSAR